MLEGEELKQLLQNDTEFDQEVDMLSEMDKNAIVELFNEPMKAVSKAMEKILGKPCTLGEISADIARASLIKETLGDTYRLFDAEYKSGLSSFAFDTETIKKISSILYETVPEEGEVTGDELRGFREVLSQMISSLVGALEKTTDANITLKETDNESKIGTLDENVIQLSISLDVNEDINTTMYYYITFAVVNTLLKVLKSKMPKEYEEENHTVKGSPDEPEEESSATVQPICFEELTENLAANQKENMNLLMDLQLQVSVELGKVKKPIKDILQFTQGTIVELDRLAGDNVDVLISGKIIAKGEVVVVDQNFGVRITKIVLPEKRVL